MDVILSWLVKAIVVIILAPFVVCVAVQLVAGIVAIVLPWVIGSLIGLAVLAGLIAGASAGLVLRRRLPYDAGRRPIAGDAIRRPRGPRGHGA